MVDTARPRVGLAGCDGADMLARRPWHGRALNFRLAAKSCTSSTDEMISPSNQDGVSRNLVRGRIQRGVSCGVGTRNVKLSVGEDRGTPNQGRGTHTRPMLSARSKGGDQRRDTLCTVYRIPCVRLSSKSYLLLTYIVGTLPEPWLSTILLCVSRTECAGITMTTGNLGRVP